MRYWNFRKSYDQWKYNRDRWMDICKREEYPNNRSLELKRDRWVDYIERDGHVIHFIYQ